MYILIKLQRECLVALFSYKIEFQIYSGDQNLVFFWHDNGGYGFVY